MALQGTFRTFGRSLWQSLRIMARNKVGFAGFIVTLIIVLTAFIAPHFVPLDMSAKVDQIYLPPSAEHPLGTDFQGRDIFRQILHGGREVIYVAALSAFLVVLISVVLGSLAAMLGGWVDTLVNAASELVLTIPHFPLLLVLAGFIRLTSPAGLAVILAAIGWGTLTRTIRAQVLSLKERDYVQAARALGLPVSHLLFREIMPNMMSYLLTQFVLTMTQSIYSQVGLIFLGIIPLATHNWGVMINLAWNQGAIYGTSSIWYLMTPIAMIVILQYALISMNRSLEELFNPRLRSGE
jgi:peptide/nickel transport system permease protein